MALCAECRGQRVDWADASRHPDRGLRGPDDPQLRPIKADVHDGRSVAEALLLLGITFARDEMSINCAHARCRRDPLWAASCNRTVKVASAGSGSGLVGWGLRGMGLGPSPVSERPILAATGQDA